MTQEHSHHPSGPLTLAMALAAVAGFIDAHIYVNVTPVFVANMSGNLVHLGIFVGARGWRASGGSLVAIAAFLGGVVAATVHHDRGLRRTGMVRPDLVLAAEAGMVAVLPALIAALSIRFTPEPVARDVPVLVVAGAAMGLQATALRRVGRVAVATTYGTGAIVRVGEKIALAARRADRPAADRRRVTIAVLVLVLVSYVGGAALASSVGSAPWLLLVPAAVLLSGAVAVRRSPMTA